MKKIYLFMASLICAIGAMAQGATRLSSDDLNAVTGSSA